MGNLERRLAELEARSRREACVHVRLLMHARADLEELMASMLVRYQRGELEEASKVWPQIGINNDLIEAAMGWDWRSLSEDELQRRVREVFAPVFDRREAILAIARKLEFEGVAEEG